MTPDQIKEARATLGLTQSKMARMLGYTTQPQYSRAESGAYPLGGARERLLRAYLDGYRPTDWPE